MAFRKTQDEQVVLDHIREQIVAKHGTLQAFANKVERPVSYISNVVRGKRAMPEWMLKRFKIKKVVVTHTHWEPM